MTLKKIDLTNFQRHRKRSIVLDPRVTVIIGKNDRGKSSIARAIKWTCLNQPAGDWMIRFGKASCKASLEFSDAIVERRKGKENAYRLDGKRHVSFGAGKVPDPVAAAIRMDDINFQGQQDGQFWFSDSPGKVSKELNRIVDLSVIDSTLQKATAHLKKATAERDVCKDRVKAAREVKRKLARVPDMAKQMDAIALLDKETVALASDLAEAEGWAGQLNAVCWSADRGRRRSGAADALRVAWDECEASRAILEEAARLAGESGRCEQTIRKTVVGTDSLGPLYAAVAAEAAQIEEAEEAAEALREAEELLCRAKRSSEEALSLLREESAGECPLCGQRTPSSYMT